MLNCSIVSHDRWMTAVVMVQVEQVTFRSSGGSGDRNGSENKGDGTAAAAADTDGR